MPLPHQPSARVPRQGVGEQVAHESRHHVQRATGMAFGRGLEVVGGQEGTGQVDALGVGHVRDHVHPHTDQAIGRGQQFVGLRAIDKTWLTRSEIVASMRLAVMSLCWMGPRPMRHS